MVGNQENIYFQQLDVKSAFLNGTLTDNVYFPQGIKSVRNKVLKLNKSMYGLRQSSKCWNKEIIFLY